MRPTPIPLAEVTPEAASAPIYFLALPMPTYKAISDAAAQRNMTLTELLSRAISEFLKNH